MICLQQEVERTCDTIPIANASLERFLITRFTLTLNSLWVARAGPNRRERWNRTYAAEFFGAVAATNTGAVVAAPFGSTGGPWRALTLTADGDVAERLTGLPEWQGHVRAVETTADGLLVAGTVAEDGGLVQVAPETYQLAPSPTRTPTGTSSETSETPTVARTSEIRTATPSDTGETTRTGQSGFGLVLALIAVLGWLGVYRFS